MFLLIDIGNSRIKWLYANKLPAQVEAVSYNINWKRKLHLSWHLLPEPEVIALSTVNDDEISQTIIALAQKLWQKPVKVFVSQKTTQDTLTIAYQDAQRLGSDRYLAMLGARSLTQEPLCVIGCGTAITLDAVDGEGMHLGGVILPGMRIAENALLQRTTHLTHMRWTPHFLGKDTASCIGAGIHHALPAGIEHIIDDLDHKFERKFKRFVFGGDAQILFGKRKGYKIDPFLIFRGMLHLLETGKTSH